jgi:hypothetical protein
MLRIKHPMSLPAVAQRNGRQPSACTPDELVSLIEAFFLHLHAMAHVAEMDRHL